MSLNQQNMSITRFKEAQERFGGYETALEEIRQGYYQVCLGRNIGVVRFDVVVWVNM